MERRQPEQKVSTTRRKVAAGAIALGALLGAGRLSALGSEGVPCDPVIDNGCVVDPNDPEATLPTHPKKEDSTTTTTPETTTSTTTTLPKTTTTTTPEQTTTTTSTTTPEQTTTTTSTTTPEQTTTTTTQVTPPAERPPAVTVPNPPAVGKSE